MNKKALSFLDAIQWVIQEIDSLDRTSDDISDIFPRIVMYEEKIMGLKKSSSLLDKQLRQDLYADFTRISSVLKQLKYTIFEEYIDTYLSRMQVTLEFMYHYPHLFLDDTDDQMASIIDMYDVCWRFLWEIYMDSPTPEKYFDLCKNIPLSDEEKNSIVTSLIHKIFSTWIRDAIEHLDWDDGRKKTMVYSFKASYPKASNSTLHTLLSKNKRAALKKDFLLYIQSWFVDVLKKDDVSFVSRDLHTILRSFAISLTVFSRESFLDSLFDQYITFWTKNSLRASQEKKLSNISSTALSSSDFLSAFSDSSKDFSSLKPLPNSLVDDMSAYFCNMNLTSSDKLFIVAQKIIQKLYSKNEYVRKQRFMDKIAWYGYGCVGDDFFSVLEKHGISCIDGNKSSSLSWKEKSWVGVFDENSCTDSDDMSVVSSSLSWETQDILLQLESLDMIQRSSDDTKETYLSKKISWCADVFERIGYTFENKKNFIQTTTAYCLSNTRFYKEIKKLLYAIVVKWFQEQRKDGKDYYVFNLLAQRRIILPKKWVISTILPHDKYEKYIKNNF